MAKIPMDDVDGTIKNVIFRKVKSDQIVVHTPKEFSDAAVEYVPYIITVYLPRSDEIVESESIRQAPFIPETPSIHKFIRHIIDRGDCSTEFFKMAADQEASQWYIKACDVVCGHEKSNKSNNECLTFEEWYTEDESECLQCPICKQWFHETCFYV